MRPRRTLLGVLALAGALAVAGCSSKGDASAKATSTPTASASASSDPNQPDVYRSTEPIDNKNYPFLIQAIPGLPDGTIVVRLKSGVNPAGLIQQAERLPGVTSVERKDDELRLKTDGPTFEQLTQAAKAMEKADGVRQVVVVVAYADPSLTPMP